MFARLCFCSADGWLKGICFHNLFLWGLLMGSHSHICKHFAFSPLLWLPSDQPHTLKISKGSTCAICGPVPMFRSCHPHPLQVLSSKAAPPPPTPSYSSQLPEEKGQMENHNWILSDTQMDLYLFIHNDMIWSENLIFKILLNGGHVSEGKI